MLGKRCIEMLTHGEIALTDFYCIVFDDIGNANETHVYNQIIREHYYSQNDYEIV
jgi:hypothetical protein